MLRSVFDNSIRAVTVFLSVLYLPSPSTPPPPYSTAFVCSAPPLTLSDVSFIITQSAPMLIGGSLRMYTKPVFWLPLRGRGVAPSLVTQTRPEPGSPVLSVANLFSGRSGICMAT